MSILYENDYGYFISHEKYIDELYKNTYSSLKVKPNLFRIQKQYKSSHKDGKNKILDYNKYEALSKEQEVVKSKFGKFMSDFMQEYKLSCHETENTDALETARLVYEMTENSLVKSAHGANIGPATLKTIDDIEKYLEGKRYDLILLDPPWWNKYIRRKRKKSGDAYKMLFNDDIKNLPIESLLKENGIVIVWCTNSQQHIHDLLTKIFPKWNVKFLGKWYWMKITLSGKPICSFSLPPGKQPFEQILFACRGDLCSVPFKEKLVVSVPSAIHSHKPPLVELIKEFLPESPSCLEIFARYLLPNWTSYGNEVLRLQHESLFVTV